MKEQPKKSLSPMEYAMKYLTGKDRTVSEMQAYLDGKEFGEADVDATVNRLLELGLLNDERYAQRFVETRLASKPVTAVKFARQFSSLEPEKRRERVLSRLIARGFTYDVSRKALEAALSEEETWSES